MWLHQKFKFINFVIIIALILHCFLSSILKLGWCLSLESGRTENEFFSPKVVGFILYFQPGITVIYHGHAQYSLFFNFHIFEEDVHKTVALQFCLLLLYWSIFKDSFFVHASHSFKAFMICQKVFVLRNFFLWFINKYFLY